ncbi:MAG: hypothetical protein OXT09_28585, partial [Myxococcales bacterium]|nr:hypothetical protein [Myxococcales bacterium]
MILPEQQQRPTGKELGSGERRIPLVPEAGGRGGEGRERSCWVWELAGAKSWEAEGDALFATG